MDELVIRSYPKSMTAEAIKKLQTNLRFSRINSMLKTICITSSIAGEGKSFIASNLATTFADSGEKVLIIDCDLRNGKQWQIFHIHNDLGFTDMIIDKSWKKNINKYLNSTQIANLDVLIVGSIPPNPSILLESKRAEEIVNFFKEQYDVIILDSTPILGMPDALITSKFADIILLVAQYKKTTVELLENAKEDLKNINIKIDGIVLNRMETKKISEYNK